MTPCAQYLNIFVKYRNIKVNILPYFHDQFIKGSSKVLIKNKIHKILIHFDPVILFPIIFNKDIIEYKEGLYTIVFNAPKIII